MNPHSSKRILARASSALGLLGIRILARSIAPLCVSRVALFIRLIYTCKYTSPRDYYILYTALRYWVICFINRRGKNRLRYWCSTGTPRCIRRFFFHFLIIRERETCVCVCMCVCVCEWVFLSYFFFLTWTQMECVYSWMNLCRILIYIVIRKALLISSRIWVYILVKGDNNGSFFFISGSPIFLIIIGCCSFVYPLIKEIIRASDGNFYYRYTLRAVL